MHSVADVDAIIGDTGTHGRQACLGYMKQYDPAVVEAGGSFAG
ncbi:MAG: hypothetical protein R3C32_01900 [Chloroflexota bacterium]